MTKPLPLVIAGGGLAGCLVALAFVARRPDVDILLVEQEATFGGNHIWSFFNSDVAAKDRWLLDPVIGKSWPDHEVRFPHRQRRIGIGYNSIRSTDIDAEVRKQLRTDQYRLGIRIEDISPTRLVLTGGEQIEGIGVIDARGMAPVSGLDLGWQKFVGRTYAFDGPHGVDRPIIMDATVAQDDGYRFVYSLPFSDDELMVEDTYYSTSPVLAPTLIRGRLERLVAKGDGPAPVVRSEETGVLPVLLGGQIEVLWPDDQPPIAKLGLRGGFFHPTTGYSLPDAVRNAVLLAEQADLGGPALYRLLEGRARQCWKERGFYQMLNRMLFRGAAPNQRYRVLEHFYRLPEAIIGRFYAGRLTAFDKLRILSGRPPIPILNAIDALRGAAA